MAMLDLSWLAYYMTIAGFLLVFIVMYAIFRKTKILGENEFMNAFAALILAIIFVTFSPGVEYVQSVVPWFAILVVCMLFIMMIVGFAQKDVDKFLKPGFTWAFVVILIIVFLIAAIKVFNPLFVQFLPGTDLSNPTLMTAKNFFYSERFLGGALLAIVAAISAWILVKKVK